MKNEYYQREIAIEESLKQRLKFICEFSKVTPIFINGSIRKIDKTNLSYIEPHRLIIKDIKDKLRLAICMSQSKWSGLIYNTKNVCNGSTNGNGNNRAE